MIGQHPITGKPIRIMRTETHLYRDKKTLVWLRSQEVSRRYSRWDQIVTNIHDLKKWTNTLGSSPTLFVCDSTDDDEVKQILDSGSIDGVHLNFFRRDPLVKYGKENLTKKGYQNIICIEEIQVMYPHTHFKWSSTTTPLEEIVYAIALLFRLQKVIGFTHKEKESLIGYREATSHFPTTIGGYNEVPQELWLIQQYFTPTKLIREKEIDLCLKKNLECPFIDKIILLNEQSFKKKLPKNDKIKEVVIGHRMTYWDVLTYIQTEVPKDVFVAFSNSDIFLDHTWQLLWSTNLEDRFLSILRYEEVPNKEPELFGPRPDSQDTWVVSSTSLKERTLKEEDFDFEFGRAGCDNAINLSMLKNKFVVCNPALTLKTHHVHNSGIRTYNPRDLIDKPVYLHIEPTGLHDMQPLADLAKYEQPLEPSQPFSRTVKGDKKEVRTLCTM
jgi:hypothetical protein